jgi:predicted small lipoprotein YifL
MTRRSTLLALLLLGPLAACEKKGETTPEAVKSQPADQTVDQTADPTTMEDRQLRRPPPASSGISSDPNNPSGAPGPSRVGTSTSRY